MEAKILTDTPYGSLISSYFQKEFPHTIKGTKQALLDILTDIFIGTKDLRQGPIPSIEILTQIRIRICDAMRKNLPIPIFVPWGGRKSNAGNIIDIAEVVAIKRLVELDSVVKEYFSPGLQINIGIEDIGAMWLYRNQKDYKDTDVNLYSTSFRDLVMMLRGSANITPVRESALMSKHGYFVRASHLSDMLFDTIKTMEAFPTKNIETINSFRTLRDLGWKGDIPKEQRDYYISRYKSLYGIDHEAAVQLLAEYFAGAKVRYDMGGKGYPISDVDGRLQINFVNPIPDTPKGMFDTALYYRTMPTSESRTHIAPWRGKGYLKIDGNIICTKMVSWNDPRVSELINSRVSLEEGAMHVELQTDFFIQS